MKTTPTTTPQRALGNVRARAAAFLVAIGVTHAPLAALAQSDPQFVSTQVQVAAPFGPQNGDGAIANGNLKFPISLGAYTVGYYSAQPPPSGSFDEGFGRNVKVFPSILPDSTPRGPGVAFVLRDEAMREHEFLTTGRAKDLSDLRTWEKLPAPLGGYRIKHRDGSLEEYQQSTPSGTFLTSLTDINGNVTTISYNPNTALPTLVTLPAKRGVVRYENDGTHITQINPPLSGPSFLLYSDDLLQQVRGADTAPRLQIGYDSMGLGIPTKLTLANGDTTQFWFKLPPGESGPAVLYKIKNPFRDTSYLTHARTETTVGSDGGAPVLKVAFAINAVTGKVYQRELYKNNRLVKRVELEPQTGRPIAIQSGNNKKVLFSYDPAGSFDSRDVSSPIVTGIRHSGGQTTVFRYDPSNSFRTQRIEKTNPGGFSQAVQLSWNGSQLREKMTTVNGALAHKATYQYVGNNRYPAAVHETEVSRLKLNERGIPVAGTSADGHAWEISATPTLLKVTVDGVVSTTNTSYSADGVRTEISERGEARLIRVTAPSGLHSRTNVQIFRPDATQSSGSGPRASMLMDLAYAQSGGTYVNVGSESCGPGGGSIQGPGGAGGASGDGGAGGGPSCYEKTKEQTSPSGKTTETTEVECGGGGAGGGSSSATTNPSSKSSSRSSSSKKGGNTDAPPEEPKEPRVPRAGDIYRGVGDELFEDLDYASNFVSSLPEAIADAYNDEVDGLADALADLPNVASDVFNTYFGSDSYQSQSNLFKSVENGDLSIGDVAVDLGSMGLASVAHATWNYANGGSGEEFSKAMGAFGGMTIGGAALGEVGSLGFRGIRSAVGRGRGQVASGAVAEAGDVAVESGNIKPPPTEVDPASPSGAKGICTEERPSPSRNTAEWPEERIPQAPWQWEGNPRVDIDGNPSPLIEVADFVDSIKNFPEITEPPEIVEWGIDSGRAWVKISAEGQEGIWYRSSGRAGSDPNTKYPGEWLPIAGKMGNWFAKDVEAIAYIKQGDAFNRYVNQIRKDYNVDVGHVTPRPDLGWLSKWLEGHFTDP